MARDHKIRGERYHDCDICGFTYRHSDTIIHKNGLRVCIYHCMDGGRDIKFARVVVSGTPILFTDLDTYSIISKGYWPTSGEIAHWATARGYWAE